MQVWSIMLEYRSICLCDVKGKSRPVDSYMIERANIWHTCSVCVCVCVYSTERIFNKVPYTLEATALAWSGCIKPGDMSIYH